MRQRTNAAVTAVAGMGGVGKTTLAAEYCHRFGGQYSGVWWIRAEQDSVLLSDLKDLGRKLGLKDKQNVEEAAKDCLDDLANKTQPFLLVYDNAPNPDTVRKHLPHGATRCIITSRFTEFGDIAQVTRLDKWADEIARDYLLSRTGRNDAAGALRLAKTLDGLPLAAEQAAAFLKTRAGISFDDYIGEIGRLIKEPRPEGAKGEYPDTVYAAFVKSLDALQTVKGGQTALDILRLCAFLSPDGIDLSLLTGPSGRNVLPIGFTDAIVDKFKREDALAALISHSLLRREDGQAGDLLVFHRLLLAVVRDWMGKDARARWGGGAVGLVNVAFPEKPNLDPSVWPLCARLIPHIVFFKDQIPYENTLAELVGVVGTAVSYLVAIGNHDGALGLAEPFVKELRKQKPPRPLNLSLEQSPANFFEQALANFVDINNFAGLLKNLADIYLDLHRCDEAEESIRESLRLRELISSSPRELAHIATLQSLAAILTKKGKFVEAEKHFAEIENVTKAVFGDPSVEYGSTLNAVAEHYSVRWQKTGNKMHRRRAMVRAEKALAIARELYGERHPATANRLSFYSLIKPKKARVGNLLGAVAELEESVAIMLSLALPEHPFAKMARNQLIVFLRGCSQPNKADRIVRGDYSDLVPVIHQIEDKHRAWVAQDPANREFGPPSPYTGARK
jgi:tetratricopeptide (TPR) repeat protein